ncbi:MAG: glycosyltransferase [Thermodesulfobacteriota bacterium]
MKNQTILIIGYSDWNHWRPTHEIARIFSENNLVIFAERLMGYGDLRWREVKRVDCLKRFQFKPLHLVSKNLFVVQPPPHPLPSSISIFSRFIGKQIMCFSNYLGKILQAKWLKICLRRQGIKPTVLFLNHPSDLHLAGRFGERVSCWWIYDELSLASVGSNYSNMLNKIEHKCIGRIDLVLASSRKQYENRKEIHPNVFYIPNGVDFTYFNRAMNSKSYEPDDLLSIPRPRIGYAGNIEHERMDYNLLQKIAKTHPEWSLVLIGWISSEAQEKVKSLAQLQNVYILPYKPHTVIPNYLKRFDVGLISFRVTPFSNAMHPMKMYEYLAVGLPVVSTMLDELKPYIKVVSIARNIDEFVRLIEKALITNSPEMVQARVEVARENSWEHRMADISALIGRWL